MVLGRSAEQDETTHHIQEWQLWLSFFLLPPFVLFLKLTLCQLCNSNTLWNILMVFGRNVEQDEITCCVKEWQLCFSYFPHYLPLLYLRVIMHWFRVRYISRTPFRIFWWYLVVMKNRTRRHVSYKNDNFGLSLLLQLSPLLCLNLISCLCCNTNTLRNILMILGTNAEQDEMTCCVQEWQLWWHWVRVGGHLLLFFSKNTFSSKKLSRLRHRV